MENKFFHPKITWILILLTLSPLLMVIFVSVEKYSNGDELCLIENSSQQSKKSQISEKYESRRFQVQNVCQRALIQDPAVEARMSNTSWWRSYLMYEVEKYNFAFCSIPKVASSTWLSNFLQLKGIKNVREHMNEIGINRKQRRPLIRLMMFYLPTKMDFDEALMNDLTSAVFVRDPFQRFASGYYDKMVMSDWRHISLDYKERWMRDFIFKEYRGVDNPLEDPESPTPAEFVRFINEEFAFKRRPVGEFDPHFMPQWATCPFCRVDFDIIGKLDVSYEEDRDNFFSSTGIPTDDVSVDQHANSHKDDPNINVPKDVLFFSQVPRGQVEQLYQNYKLDFELFDYAKPDFDIYERYNSIS